MGTPLPLGMPRQWHLAETAKSRHTKNISIEVIGGSIELFIMYLHSIKSAIERVST